MNTILCFLSLSLIGWICLFMGLSKSRHFKSRAAVETSRAEGIIQSYEVKEKPWGRGPTARCYHPVVSFTVDGHPYTATSDFYYLEMRGQEPKRLPEGSDVVLYYNPSNPFKFHLELETDDVVLFHASCQRPVAPRAVDQEIMVERACISAYGSSKGMRFGARMSAAVMDRIVQRLAYNAPLECDICGTS